MVTDRIKLILDLNDISDKISEASDGLEHLAEILYNRTDVDSTDTCDLKNLEQKIKKFNISSLQYLEARKESGI